jgi:hypothetical protein
MPPERLTHQQAKKLIAHILRDGRVIYARPHAITRMQERDITTVDCENILRGGVVQEPELEHGAWRYLVSTRKMAVVVEFLSEDSLLIVTAWRFEK